MASDKITSDDNGVDHVILLQVWQTPRKLPWNVEKAISCRVYVCVFA